MESGDLDRERHRREKRIERIIEKMLELSVPELEELIVKIEESRYHPTRPNRAND